MKADGDEEKNLCTINQEKEVMHGQDGEQQKRGVHFRNTATTPRPLHPKL
jgi:hypothetical protein